MGRKARMPIMACGLDTSACCPRLLFVLLLAPRPSRARWFLTRAFAHTNSVRKKHYPGIKNE